MKISRMKLQETFNSNEFKELRMTFESLEDLLDGDLDLEIARLEGCQIEITLDFVELKGNVLKDLEILNRISSLDENDHMKLYEKYGKFHDGGDDLDYGGSFVGLLYDLLKKELVADEMSLEDAKEIEELDLDKMMNLEEQKKLFKELKYMIKSDHPEWDDWGASYWAVTLMKVQLAIGGDIITLLTDRDIEPGYISIVGKPDYGS